MSFVSIPTELVLSIGGNLSTRDASVLGRTCHTLHTRLTHLLERRYRAELEEVIVWAAKNFSLFHLKRTLSLLPPQPDSGTRTRLATSLGRSLKHEFGHEFALPGFLKSITLEHIETLKLLLSNGINFIGVYISGWSIFREYGESIMLYAVQHGDLELARWLLDDAGVTVHANDLIFRNNTTLLDLARYRMFEVPRGENVEEIIALLVHHDLRPTYNKHPAGQDRKEIEDILKKSSNLWENMIPLSATKLKEHCDIRIVWPSVEDSQDKTPPGKGSIVVDVMEAVGLRGLLRSFGEETPPPFIDPWHGQEGVYQWRRRRMGR